MPDPVKLPPRPPALTANALQSAAYARGSYLAIVPNHITLDDVLTPAYWQHHVPALSGKPFPVIEVIREDGTLEVWLRVMSTKPGMAVVRPIFPAIVVGVDGARLKAAEAAKASEGAVVLPPGYKHAHVPQGANRGHMLRLPNGAVLTQGEATKKAAANKGWMHYRESMRLPLGTEPLTKAEEADLALRTAPDGEQQTGT